MTKKTYFVLKNIDPVEIDAKYRFYVPDPGQWVEGEEDLTFDSMLASAASRAELSSGGRRKSLTTTGSEEEPSVPSKSALPVQRTKITDLSTRPKEQCTFSYLDESKKEHSCVLTMVQQKDQEKMPETTVSHCFWCRHGFEFRPLGCPLQYTPHRLVKNYYSEITKDNYTLRENISMQQCEENQDIYCVQQMEMQDRNFYIMDGVFCSFNCCLAFIQDNAKNPLYTYSHNLLTKLYFDLFGEQAQPIVPAPSWRLLKAYGGHLSIEEFRRNFYRIEYSSVENVLFPRHKPISFLFEKQVRI